MTKRSFERSKERRRRENVKWLVYGVGDLSSRFTRGLAPHLKSRVIESNSQRLKQV